MIEIPLDAIPNQSLLIDLNGQDCAIAVYARNARLFLDLHVGGQTVCQGEICQPGVGIVQRASNLFSGQLGIVDTLSQPFQQKSPQWTELGTRWKLYWLTEGEMDEIGQDNFENALSMGAELARFIND